jgi:hypothetical protein
MVRRFTNHLLDAYEQFINAEPGDISYIDGFMAAHNFHCQIVFHLGRDAGFLPTETLDLRRIAIATFTERMKREPLPEVINVYDSLHLPTRS